MDRFRTVLCPIDFSALTKSTLEVASRICQRFGARLVLHHNQGPIPPDFLSVHWMWSEEHEQHEQRKDIDAAELLQRLFETVPADVDVEAKITRGPLEKGVLFLAKTLPADLVVMGSHGWSTPEHRSVTERVVLEAPCTVLTIRDGCDPEKLFATRPGKRPHALPVLVVVDRLDGPNAALDFALALAERMPHELDLLHVLKPTRPDRRAGQRERRIDDARQRLESLIPELLTGRARVHVAEGNPGQEILNLAQTTEPLFMLVGARKKTLLRRKRAKQTSLEVLHGAECPAWFVPESSLRPKPR
ncbi:MAG: universal stress protein [Acidobacteriota bacterium]|nr:universal stress protein [Acidobacteriota bacterium]